MCPDDWLTDIVLFLLMMKEIKKVGKDLGITPTIIRDEELKERGFGGISCWKFPFFPSSELGYCIVSIVIFYLCISEMVL